MNKAQISIKVEMTRDGFSGSVDTYRALVISDEFGEILENITGKSIADALNKAAKQAAGMEYAEGEQDLFIMLKEETAGDFEDPSRESSIWSKLADWDYGRAQRVADALMAKLK